MSPHEVSYYKQHTHTHTHRHTHTHARAHTHTRRHARTHTRTHTHARAHAHTHAGTHARTRIHACARTRTFMPCAYTYAHTYDMCIHCTHIHYTLHAHTHTHTHAHTRTHTRTHARTHARTHVRARVDTNTKQDVRYSESPMNVNSTPGNNANKKMKGNINTQENSRSPTLASFLTFEENSPIGKPVKS